MSLRNAKPTQAQTPPAAPETANTAADVATAVVQPPAPASASPRPPDAAHGRGGLYTVKAGRRVLVQATQSPALKEQA
ncbi:hypothetical protein [Comamonas flocculans]|uniref:Uncharacterized protein n=1 Tax=Comamonas flocculans TaxID=2597701 RepID=A0A5B8S0Q4_9BURK|nr:hypothetical protein [Comamonas flocculans]QEA14275.1 hypothetical protein FOZ74_15235 [Comamonas flocculans]